MNNTSQIKQRTDKREGKMQLHVLGTVIRPEHIAELWEHWFDDVFFIHEICADIQPPIGCDVGGKFDSFDSCQFL